MEIIGTTVEGYILSATITEIKAILASTSVPVSKENPIVIGTKIPAFDYAASINKCKEFKNSYTFKEFKRNTKQLFTDSEEIITSLETLK